MINWAGGAVVAYLIPVQMVLGSSPSRLMHNDTPKATSMLGYTQIIIFRFLLVIYGQSKIKGYC